eukprot:2649852-Alexandrium_andersonii.AAC.1
MTKEHAGNQWQYGCANQHVTPTPGHLGTVSQASHEGTALACEVLIRGDIVESATGQPSRQTGNAIDSNIEVAEYDEGHLRGV